MNGTITYDAKRRAWVVECAPHIAMRLKRVFGKLSKRSQGKHILSDTPETARDLQWFCDRYPLHVTDSARLQAAADVHRERQAIVDAMLANRMPPPAFDLAIPAREYQRIAAGLLLASGRLLLADDVGLGKTCSAICALADARTLPAVVVTLTHLTHQFKAEIQRFAPKLNVHICKTGKAYDVTAKRESRHGQMAFPEALPDVFVLNYHKLSGWAETLSKIAHTVIFDECQELRRSDSNKYEAAQLLAHAAQFRMGLSATPIYNYGGEIWNVMNCLAPGELGTKEEFGTEWCGYAMAEDKAKIKDPRAFGSYMRESGLMLRRTRADVRRELPEATSVLHFVETDKAALDTISGSAGELARIILAQGPELERGLRLKASGELDMIIRQATGIAKAPYVAEFVRLLIESGERVVLYGWHRAVYEIWKKQLEPLKPVFYTGAESVTQKEAAKRAFVNGDTSLIILSLRSGAGLDGLQNVCRTAVFGELDWSPAVHEQCLGRIWRDGQADPVMAYYMVADEGSDPIVMDVLGLKQGQIEGLRQTSEDDLFQRLSGDGNHIKRLAESYLKGRAE